MEAHAVTSGPKHHFFGYYDKFPWNANSRYMIGLETEFMDRPPTAEDRAVIGLIDLEDGNRWKPLAETTAWNWQQGTMLQWVGTEPERKIIYNIRAGERFGAVVQDVESGEMRELPRPVYALSRDGRQAVTPNFARTARTRPGYGYEGPPDPWEDEPYPDEDGIYWMDVESGENRLIVSLDQVVGVCYDDNMGGTKHWFNHLQFNTDGSRFLFLHRWVVADGRRMTRMFTVDPDGRNLCCLADHEMVSHFDWRDEICILAWARRFEIGDRYFLFTDPSGEVEVIGDGVLTQDGHCSYSPDLRWVLTDTYPDKEGKRTLILFDPERERRIDIGKFYAMPDEITGEIRCDLHPRWSRDGKKVCFDSVHEGTRQIYAIDVEDIVGG